jgi:hypothetical protein
VSPLTIDGQHSSSYLMRSYISPTPVLHVGRGRTGNKNILYCIPRPTVLTWLVSRLDWTDREEKHSKACSPSYQINFACINMAKFRNNVSGSGGLVGKVLASEALDPSLKSQKCQLHFFFIFFYACENHFTNTIRQKLTICLFV